MSDDQQTNLIETVKKADTYLHSLPSRATRESVRSPFGIDGWDDQPACCRTLNEPYLYAQVGHVEALLYRDPLACTHFDQALDALDGWQDAQMYHSGFHVAAVGDHLAAVEQLLSEADHQLRLFTDEPLVVPRFEQYKRLGLYFGDARLRNLRKTCR